jgi:phosphate transport system permease protein
MTINDTSADLDEGFAPADVHSLIGGRLPKAAGWLVLAISAAGGGVPALALGWPPAAWAVCTVALFGVLLVGWSRLIEGHRAAVNRLATYLVWAAFALVMLPLFSLLWTVVSNGASVISTEFLTYSMRGIIGEGGGIYHAIIGTVLITLAASVISIPIGLMSAIYLTEYGGKSKTAKTITFLVDVMTGIPSIVAGLFAYALFALFFGEGVRMGIGGSVALSLLMIPIMVRSSEEMLKLVPLELREAAYALGVPKWLTIVRVVLPTALSGLITGATLAVARIVGETAPLLIIAGYTDSVNNNLFSERMMSLPVYIYYSYTQPGVPAHFGHERAWGAALVLIVIVMALSLLASAAGKFFAPKRGR